MGAESVIRFDRFGDEIRSLAFFARVFDLAEVRIRPAVESAVFNARQIIRNQIVAEQIALIDDRPQSLGWRLPIHADGVAQPPANTRMPLPSGLISKIPARRGSFSPPSSSSTLEVEPTAM